MDLQGLIDICKWDLTSIMGISSIILSIISICLSITAISVAHKSDKRAEINHDSTQKLLHEIDTDTIEIKEAVIEIRTAYIERNPALTFNYNSQVQATATPLSTVGDKTHTASITASFTASANETEIASTTASITSLNTLIDEYNSKEGITHKYKKYKIQSKE